MTKRIYDVMLNKEGFEWHFSTLNFNCIDTLLWLWCCRSSLVALTLQRSPFTNGDPWTGTSLCLFLSHHLVAFFFKLQSVADSGMVPSSKLWLNWWQDFFCAVSIASNLEELQLGISFSVHPDDGKMASGFRSSLSF